MSTGESVVIRSANEGDAAVIVALIRELAEYERLAHACEASEELLVPALFGDHKYAEVLIAEVGGQTAAFALFFCNFSTFLSRPGIYLEDLFVRPHFRGMGIGRALLAKLASIAVERNFGRVEWSVLDWNESAIGFYKQMGAVAMDEWTVYRLTGDALKALASTTNR